MQNCNMNDQLEFSHTRTSLFNPRKCNICNKVDCISCCASDAAKSIVNRKMDIIVLLDGNSSKMQFNFPLDQILTRKTGTFNNVCVILAALVLPVHSSKFLTIRTNSLQTS